MSLEEQNITQIQLENIGVDYAQFISQATIAHVAHVSDTGEIVAFVEQHVDPNQQENIDPNQNITLANFDPQQLHVEHVVFEQLPEGTQIQTLEFLPPLQQHQQQQAIEGVEQKKPDIKPPVGKGPFPCESCDKIFPKWNQLQRHLKTHDEDKPYRCTQCTSSFNIEDNLRLHMATHVPPDADPKCPECGKTFSRIASLKAHIMVHEKEETLMCTECGDEFGLQSQLDKHLQEHRQEQAGVKSYPCKQCNVEFNKPTYLREHMKQHYKIKASLNHRPYKRNVDRSAFHYKCQHCGKTFQKPSQLVRHNRIHTGERPYKCTLCNRAFNQKGALRIHMSKHTGDKPFICDFCPHTFAQKGNLRAHIKRVHTLPSDGEDLQTFRCGECSCVFRKLGSLNAHISREHSEQTEMPMPSDSSRHLFVEEHNDVVINQILGLSEQSSEQDNGQLDTEGQTQEQIINGQQVSNSDILQQALENSGLPSGDAATGVVVSASSTTELISVAPLPLTSLQCAPITQTVTTMTLQDAATGSVKKHIIRKVNGVRWHQCTYCAKEFKKPSDLVRHIRIHTHEKPYKCTQCFRSFAVKSTLTAHIKTHSGIKDFKCDLCTKMFSTQGSLKVHLRMHTGAKPFECPQCDKSFRTSAHRKSHITSHFKDGDIDRRPKRIFRRINKQEMVPDIPLQEPILITDTGLIQQPPRNNLLTHYLGEAASVDRPYKCGFCSRGYKKSSHLKQHVRSHTGEKPYKCIQCMKSFVSSGVLKAHIRTHTGVKSYKCLICDSLFTTNGSLKRHMSTHSEVRPFMCPYCQKTFKTSVNCKKHMKTHRHELALQALQQDGQDVEGDSQDASDKAQADLVEENNLADLVLQQTDQSTAINQNDSLAQASIQDALNTASLDHQFQQTLNHQIFGQPQTYSQSLLGSGQQNFAQINQLNNPLQPNNVMTSQLNNQLTNQISAPLNSQLTTPINDSLTNQNVGQLDTQMFNANSFQIQGQQLQDLNTLNFSQGVTSLTTSLPSTSMQNILPTSDVTILEAEEAETVDKEQPAAPTQQDEPLQKDDNDTPRPYPCTVCDKSFKKSSHLKQHMRSHTGEKPYFCDPCGKRFVSASVLKSHEKTHHAHNILKQYHCTVCKAEFTTNGSLIRHMSVHERQKRSQRCPYCEESFKTHNMLKRHIKTHSDVIEEDLALNKRPKAVMQIVEEQQELDQEVEEEDQLNVSKRILFESSSEKEKDAEEKIQEAQDDSDAYPKHAHQCNHCSKSFKKPSDLVRHIRIHTGEKPFKCDTCGRAFTVKSTLDSHMRTHENSSKNFKCHVCSAMFATKGSLKVHMRLHTGAKPFRCIHCDQRFRTSGNRKSHVLQHFKNDPVRRRKARDIEENVQSVDFIPTSDVQNVMTINQTNPGQVITVDQAMLGAQSILPVSLTVQPDNPLSATGLSESALATQVLQGLEGIQLQLTGNQGLQITGLDPNIFSQTVQIDANLLQQLQQQGNINITINPNFLTQTLQTADPNVIQNVQIQQPETINPNIVVQPMSTITMTDVNSQNMLATSGAGVVMTDGAPNAFVVSGDGTIPNDHQITVTQTDLTEVDGMGDINVGDEENNEDDEDEDDDDVDLDDSLEDNLNGTVEENALLQHSIDHDNLTHGSHSANISLQDVSQAVNPVTGEKYDDDSRQYRCGICSKSFKRSGHLKEHLMIHQPDSKPFKSPGNHKCQHCNKSFQKPSQLERHIRIHTGERPFCCDICSKSFNQKNALQIHMKKHSGEKPHKCIYCELAFTQKGNLKTHIKRAHHMDMVHSMNIPKSYVPPAGATVNISTEGEGETTRDEDGINLDEMADLMNVI